MTREQFLDGCEFRQVGDKFTRYKFIPGDDPNDIHLGYLVELFGNPATGTTVSREYHAGIRAVTKSRFQCYSSICGSTVRAWRNFSDFETV